MKVFVRFGPASCGEPVVERLLGGEQSKVPYCYRQSSTIEMVPLGLPQVVVWGKRDNLVPLELGEHYARKAQAAGDSAKLLVFAEAGHFEIAKSVLADMADHCRGSSPHSRQPLSSIDVFSIVI